MLRSFGVSMALIGLLSFAIVGCSAPNRLTLDWADSDYEKQVGSVLVIGVSENETTRRVFENVLSERLGKKKVKARPSWSVLTQEDLLDEERMKSEVARLAVDAVLVTRVLAVDKETDYVPPRTTTHYAPYNYYSGMYPYYYNSYNTSVEPGYYQENTIATLESNMYEAKGGSLIWSAQSQAFNPTNVERVIDDISKLIVDSLNSRKMLTKYKKKSWE